MNDETRDGDSDWVLPSVFPPFQYSHPAVTVANARLTESGIGTESCDHVMLVPHAPFAANEPN